MQSHRFEWHELMTSDPDAAQGFYRRVVGWGTQPFEGHEHMDYSMWTVGERPVGGVIKLPEEARAGGVSPHWSGASN